MKRREAIKISFYSAALAGAFGSIASGFAGCTQSFPEENKLLVLNEEQAAVLKIIADQYLPSSDIPGANDIDVIPAIDQYLYHFLNEDNRNAILVGLNNINVLSFKSFDRKIDEIDERELDDLMIMFSEDAARTKNWKLHLFFVLRELVVKSYFESKEIAQKVLKYDPIPGQFSGCVPYKEVGGQWSL